MSLTPNQKYSIQRNQIKMSGQVQFRVNSSISLNYLKRPREQIQVKISTSEAALRTTQYGQLFSPSMKQQNLRIKTCSFDKNIFNENKICLRNNQQTTETKNLIIKKRKIGFIFENYNQVKQNVRLGSRHYERFMLPKCVVGKYGYSHLQSDEVKQLYPLNSTFKLLVMNYLLNSPDNIQNKIDSIKYLIQVCEKQDEMERIAIFLNQQLLQLFERKEKFKQQ